MAFDFKKEYREFYMPMRGCAFNACIQVPMMRNPRQFYG